MHEICRVISLSDLRKRAVAAVLDGRTHTEVGQCLGVSRQTIGIWMAEYRHSDEASLTYGNRGRPKGGRLSAGQRKQVFRAAA